MGFGSIIELVRAGISYATLKECRERNFTIDRGAEKYFLDQLQLIHASSAYDRNLHKVWSTALLAVAELALINEVQFPFPCCVKTMSENELILASWAGWKREPIPHWKFPADGQTDPWEAES